jgi:nucleoside-diphosphate-sugar epimerase
MRILVTGGSGFVGSWLVPELRSHGHDVVAIDLPDGDLREPDVARSYIGHHVPDVVVHLAAQVGRILGEDDLHRTITTNALATARVAQACSDFGVRLVYCSTSEIYGDQGDAECVEGGPEVLPHGIYGLSKRWGEEAARLYAPDGLQIVRLSMPYGPGLPAGRGRAALINFLWQAAHGQPVTVHRGGRRSWCWIGDTVHGFRLVIECGERATTASDSERGVGVYNVGRDDNEVSMREVALKACDIVGAPRDLVVEVDPPERQTVVKRLSTRKLRSLGWEPVVELDDGMALTWDVMQETYDEHGMPRWAAA